MPKDKRTIGDNSANINPIEESAVKLIRKIYDRLIVQKEHCIDAVLGKNKTVRDNAAMHSMTNISDVLSSLEPWNKVIEAKDNGVDIHSAPIKTHKLDIVADHNHEFGQYIIDKDEDVLPPYLQKIQDFIDCKEAKDAEEDNNDK
jgi:hypothetical protein